MDPPTGKKVAQAILDAPNYSGVTATAGGLVFTATTDGVVYALNDKTLKVLWRRPHRLPELRASDDLIG